MHFEFTGTPEDADRLTSRAREEIDVSYQEFEDGIKARIAGEELDEDWSVDKKFGWRLENRIKTHGHGESVEGHRHPHTHEIVFPESVAETGEEVDNVS
jgi:hypothetical protein